MLTHISVYIACTKDPRRCQLCMLIVSQSENRFNHTEHCMEDGTLLASDNSSQDGSYSIASVFKPPGNLKRPLPSHFASSS